MRALVLMTCAELLTGGRCRRAPAGILADPDSRSLNQEFPDAWTAP